MRSYLTNKGCHKLPINHGRREKDRLGETSVSSFLKLYPTDLSFKKSLEQARPIATCLEGGPYELS
jgi:hypothetical protein